MLTYRLAFLSFVLVAANQELSRSLCANSSAQLCIGLFAMVFHVCVCVQLSDGHAICDVLAVFAANSNCFVFARRHTDISSGLLSQLSLLCIELK